MPEIKFSLGQYTGRVEKRLAAWRAADFTRRLWAKDYTIWSRVPVAEITDRLGWLDLPRESQQEVAAWNAFRDDVASAGLKHAVLLGMGGSSLAPEVFQATFGNLPGHPRLLVLDSTHPGAISDVEAQIDLGTSLFLVSSKSGSTIETMSLFQYFYKRMAEAGDKPGDHFVAITDAGSSLEKLGAEHKFRRVFLAPPDVGGRYSALSAFGLVPASLIGVDTADILRRAARAADDCFAGREACLTLGAALGELALAGRDKVLFFTSPSLKSFPQWLEQLIAESSGKDGRGIVPVVDDPLADAGGCEDRVYVELSLRHESARDTSATLKTLELRGLPVIRIQLEEKAELGAEMFRWEVAVAATCAVLGVHPFNQPDVELAKQMARKVMQETAQPGQSSDAAAVPPDSQAALGQLDSLLAGARPGDYLCIQAYLAPARGLARDLQDLRLLLARRTGLVTTLGYGPRFLHSTGQLHKGGPNTGLFVQFVDEPQGDRAIPGGASSFAQLVKAQSLGDYNALLQCDRRVVRVNLGAEPAEALRALVAGLASAPSSR